MPNTTFTPARGLWIDSPKAEVLKRDFWKRLHDSGFTTGAVMIESSARGFDPKYTLTDLSIIGSHAINHDVELVLTVWPDPTIEYTNQLEEKLSPILRASGAAAIEGDVESNFTRKRLIAPPEGQRFLSLEAASKRTIDIMRSAAADVRLEGTTFTDHPENSSRSVFIAKCDRSLNQGYSVRKRRDFRGNDFLVDWAGPMGPGLMQRRTFDRALQIPQTNGKPQLACGLAAYDQLWPGHTRIEAMTIAYQTALEYRPLEIRWWSSKWVWGPLAHPETLEFFRSLA